MDTPSKEGSQSPTLENQLNRFQKAFLARQNFDNNYVTCRTNSRLSNHTDQKYNSVTQTPQRPEGSPRKRASRKIRPEVQAKKQLLHHQSVQEIAYQSKVYEMNDSTHEQPDTPSNQIFGKNQLTSTNQTEIEEPVRVSEKSTGERLKEKQKITRSKLEEIEKELNQRTLDLDSLRQSNRFQGLPIEMFQPYKRDKHGKIEEDGVGGVNDIIQLTASKQYSQPYGGQESSSMIDLKIRNEISSMPLTEIESNSSANELPIGHSEEQRPNENQTIKRAVIATEESVTGRKAKVQHSGMNTTRSIHSNSNFQSSPKCLTSRNYFSPSKSQVLASSKKNNRRATATMMTNIIETDLSDDHEALNTLQHFETNASEQVDETIIIDHEAHIIREELLSGNIKNVVLHPQDRKRLGIVKNESQSMIAPAKEKVKKQTTPALKSQKSQRLTKQQSSKGMKSVRMSQTRLPLSKQGTPQGPVEPQSETQIRKQKTAKSRLSIQQNLSDVKQRTVEPLNAHRIPAKDPQIPQLTSPRKKTRVAKAPVKKSISKGASEIVSSTIEMPTPESTLPIAPLPMEQYPQDFRDQGDESRQSRPSTSLSNQNQKSNRSSLRKKKTGEDRARRDSQKLKQEQITDRNDYKDIVIEYDEDDDEIIMAKMKQMKENDRAVIEDREEVLQFLIEEEKILDRFGTEPLEEVQMYENQRQAELREKGVDIGQEITDFKQILLKSNIEKTRVLLFVRHLQISFILTRALIQVFSAGLLQRFQIKFQHILQNIHQNYLLMVDMILKELLLQSQNVEESKEEVYRMSQRGLKVTQLSEYRLLQHITQTKLRPKEKHAKSLTSFRQNNEVNIQNLKKVVKYIIDSYSQECVPFKVLAFDIQETMKHHMSNFIPNINTANFDLMTDLPTSTIQFINKTIQQRVELLVINKSEGKKSSSFVTTSAQKRPKSFVKQSFASSAQKQSPAHPPQGQAGKPQESLQNQNQITRINDLISSANQGMVSGILANRKSPGKQRKEVPAISITKGPLTAQKEAPKEAQMPQNLYSKSFVERRPASRTGIERPQSPGLNKELANTYNLSRKQDIKIPERLRQNSNSALGMNSSATKRVSQPLPDSTQKTKAVKREVMERSPPKQVPPSIFTPPQKSSSKKIADITSNSAAKPIVRPSSRQSDQTSKINKTVKKPKTHQKFGSFSLQKGQQSQFNSPAKVLTSGNQTLKMPQQSQQFLLPETLAFIMKVQQQTDGFQPGTILPLNLDLAESEAMEEKKPQQSIMNVNNNINFYGPVVSHVYPQMMGGKANVIELSDEEDVNNRVSYPEMQTFDKRLTQTTTKKSSRRIQQEDFVNLNNELLLKERERTERLLRLSQSTKKLHGRNSLNQISPAHNYSKEEPAASKPTGPLLKPIPQIDQKQKEKTRSKSGIGTGTKNLQKLRQQNMLQQKPAMADLPNLYMHPPPMPAPISPAHFQQANPIPSKLADSFDEDMEPPQPMALEIHTTHQKNILNQSELNEFEKLESEVAVSDANRIEKKQSETKNRYKALITNSIRSKKEISIEAPSNEVSPLMKNVKESILGTEPRNSRYSVDKDMLHEAVSQNAMTKMRKMSKRFFIGEYDATAEEEQSLLNSQIGHYDNLHKPLSHVSSPANKGLCTPFSPEKEQKEGLLKLQKVVNNEEINSAGLRLKNMLSLDLTNNKTLLSEKELIATQRSIKSKKFSLMQNNNLEDSDNSKGDKGSSNSNQLAVRRSSEKDKESNHSLRSFQNEGDQSRFGNACDEQLPAQVMATPVSQNEELKQELDEQEQIDLEYRQLRELVTIPYLPKINQLSKLPKFCKNNPYTLVVDLDETLIHFEVEDDLDGPCDEPGSYLIRPGAIRFLNQLSEYYEIVIFTAAMPDYADWILDNIDRGGSISHRLYRQHTTPHEDYAIKDLHNLGRDLSRTIIIDNLAENFNYTTPLNGIWVESWYDDMDDNVLSLLIPFLKQIVVNKVDVRDILTDHIKENILYRLLDDGAAIPRVQELLSEGCFQLLQSPEVDEKGPPIEEPN